VVISERTVSAVRPSGTRTDRLTWAIPRMAAPASATAGAAATD
jgi:hypothetical protein